MSGQPRTRVRWNSSLKGKPRAGNTKKRCADESRKALTRWWIASVTMVGTSNTG